MTLGDNDDHDEDDPVSLAEGVYLTKTRLICWTQFLCAEQMTQKVCGPIPAGAVRREAGPIK